MSTVVLSGQDSLIIDGAPITDFADADCAVLDFPNEVAAVKTGKNGNSIYAMNQTGQQATLEIRVLRGSADDKRLNNKLVQQTQNFSGFVLMTGEFIKKLGDGAGNIQNDIYMLAGGVFNKRSGAKTNVEGDTEQSVVIYYITFSKAPRAIT